MSNNKTAIPIKNLFYMLCYAWNILTIKDTIKVGEEDFEDAYNLLGRIFSFGIGKLIRSGFRHSYIPEREELSTLRGKISIKDSISSLSIQRKNWFVNTMSIPLMYPLTKFLNIPLMRYSKNDAIHKSIKKI